VKYLVKTHTAYVQHGAHVRIDMCGMTRLYAFIDNMPWGQFPRF